MKHSITAIIPARGGSKGLPRKNIRLLAGKPLITYSIKAASNSKYISKVIVSTEDSEIKKISESYGADVLIRPDELAKDTSSTESVIKHVITKLESNNHNPDIIVTLQPTSPFRTSYQIDEAINEFIDKNVDSLISLKEVKENPYKMKKIVAGCVVPFLELNLKSNRRQDMPVVYKENGAIYITKRDFLMKTGKLFDENAAPYIMSEETSLDIDTQLDLKIAECLTSICDEI